MTRYLTLAFAVTALAAAIAFTALGSERVSFVESGFAARAVAFDT